MSSPVTENDFKDLIPSATGNLCDKIAKLLTGLATKSAAFVGWMVNEDGSFTDGFKSEMCAALTAAGCSLSGTNIDVNPNMPNPSGISASDGTYTDKVRVTWNAVTPPSGITAVSSYKIYRALSTVTDPSSATLLGEVTAPTTTYDDTTAVQETTYNYWIVATNGTDTSAYGGPDVGNSTAGGGGSLAAVSDLLASQGFSTTAGDPISLVWTPPSGATKYDIYRHTANLFSAATKIASDIVPEVAIISASNETAYDNVENITFHHVPPLPTAKYYFWVVAKKDAPPATSSESNAAQGWVKINATQEGTTVDMFAFSTPYTVPASGARMQMTVFGMGGQGAGGGTVYGGGGGGAAPVASIDFAVAPGDTITMVKSPNVDDTGQSAGLANGTDGSQILIKKNGVTVATLNPGLGGVYSASGGGAGGAVGSAAGSALVTTWAGESGSAGSASSGGKGGPGFGMVRLAAAHYNGFSGVSWESPGYGGSGGGGSYAEAGVPGAPDAEGGAAFRTESIYAVFTV